MGILRTEWAPRKGHFEFEQNKSSSGELEMAPVGFPWDDGKAYPYEDDTSDYNDRDNLPDSPDEQLSDLDPQRAVEAWKIAAIGSRPKDFMGRDLLLQSLWRDERPRVFHSLAKTPPAWIEDLVKHLPDSHNKQAIQLTVLQYLHRRQLSKLFAGDVVKYEDGVVGKGILTKLWDCWPYGAEMVPPANVEKTSHGCCCRIATLCPWCFARSAIRLERLLREGPLKHPEGKHIVLARISTFGEQASPDKDWCEMYAGSDYYLQSRKKVRAMRSAMTGKLRQYARVLGISGGIITHQISPCMTKSHRWGVTPGLPSFRHNFALLGEVTFRDDAQKEWFRDDTTYNTRSSASQATWPSLGQLSSCSLSIWETFGLAGRRL